MAVDYGDSRTGIAVSDATRTLVGDAWVISSKKMQETAEAIVQEAISRDVSCIVVGYPKKMDGSIDVRAKKSEALVESLGELCKSCGHDISIELWDERLTTKSAYRVLNAVGRYGEKRKQTVDAVAAALILESYLNRKDGG